MYIMSYYKTVKVSKYFVNIQSDQFNPPGLPRVYTERQLIVYLHK